MCDLLDEPIPSGTSRKNSGDAMILGLADADVEKAPASPTRRKLPKTPQEQQQQAAMQQQQQAQQQPQQQQPGMVSRGSLEKTGGRAPAEVSGRIQLQVWYHDEKNELVVSVFAADDLAPRDESTNFGVLPQAYVQLRLLPFTGEMNAVKTEVAEPTHNPMWNTNLELHAPGEQLMDKTIEVTLWDYRPDKEQIFLGECTVDLQKALLDDTPVWYRLEDPRQLRAGASRSPRSSIASDTSIRTTLLRRGDRSLSEDTSDMEMEGHCSLLHPDHAYMFGSRRGSSQSENIEFSEPYQLPRDFSKSLPGSRRSSFQSPAQDKEELPAVPPPASYSKERRRSSVCRASMRDPDEILRNLKAVRGELLSRKTSLTDKRRTSRSGSVVSSMGGEPWRKESLVLETGPVVNMLATAPPIPASPTDEDDKSSTKSDIKQLGPGQVQPRGYQLKQGKQAEIKLSLVMTKGQLEVEVISARGITGEPPDTYVKTYLREGERWLQKRKTRVVRHSCEPQFQQTLRYAACDVLGRTLVVMLWSKQKGFEHNHGIGGAELALDKLTLTHTTLSWYPLFPIHTLGSDSNDSP